MAQRLTIKQENFCLAYVETGNASEAYRRAYDTEDMLPSSINCKASELMDNVKVTDRINELRGSIMQRHKITVDDLLAELDEARAIGKETGKAAPMVAATMGKAKLLGLDKVLEEVDTRPVGKIEIEIVNSGEKK
ncbi:MAG: hypothetical protein [Caudoviricetes sp.]|nr:MAG: hypothetical protein [Caudoviricetes sp.]